MAKQKRALPTRKQRDRSRDDESLLLRSAESLGRVIGALQRQLDGASRRLSGSAGEDWVPPIPSLTGRKATRRGTTKRAATARSAGAKNTNGGAAKKTKARNAPARKKTTKTTRKH
jgi:hypothetical protein